MHEQKPTTSDSEKQSQETECTIEYKENTNKKHLIKLIDHPITQAFIVLIIAYILIAITPKLFVSGAMEIYNNNTSIADMYITTSNGLLIAFLTFIYTLLTGNIVKQSKKEQQIRDIEKRLEEFYIPAISILNDKRRNSYQMRVVGYATPIGKQPNITHKIHIGLADINKYRYLAEPYISKKFERYIENGETSSTEIPEFLETNISKEIVKLETKLKKLKEN